MPSSLHPWSVLRANDTRKPVLLYRFSSSTSDGYQLALTDCIDAWCEQLTVDAIASRARRAECVIDPTNDRTQLEQIFDKIKAALECDDGTALTIDDDDSDSELSIRIKADLPSPLKPFKWKLQLDIDHTRDFLRKEMIVPLAREILTQNAHIEQLLQASAEKDKAVGRLLDKTETMGLNASEVFPAAIRARPGAKIPRSQIIEQVPGLRSISRKDLSASILANEQLPLDQLFRRLYQVPSGDPPGKSTQLLTLRPSDEMPRPSRKPVETAGSATGSEDEKEDAHDFIAQRTPNRREDPPLRDRQAGPGNHGQAQAPDVAESQGVNSVKPDEKVEESPPLRKKIGGIGGRRKLDPSLPGPSQDATESAQTNPSHQDADDKNGHDTAKDTHISPEMSAVQEDPQYDPLDSVLVTKWPSSGPTIDFEAPRHVDEQRIKERREELKRQLEAQPKASKKKRKF